MVIRIGPLALLAALCRSQVLHYLRLVGLASRSTVIRNEVILYIGVCWSYS